MRPEDARAPGAEKGIQAALESAGAADRRLPGRKAADKALELSAAIGRRYAALRREVGKVIVGQERVVEEIVVALAAGGHVLLEGVPGLAKTLLVSTLSRALSLVAGRIQFTPDLMPADVTGTQILGAERGAMERRFTFRKGPIFVNILLADEINRTPPKTQAACLEAMAEGQVTVGGVKHPLPRPFFVLATQNPIEDEGTYHLPEAQLDRFLLKVLIDYPTAEEERKIVQKTTGVEEAVVTPVLDEDDILALQWVVRCLRPSSHVVEYASRLVRRSRPQEPDAPPWVRKLVAWGAGPRAGQALLLAAKALTLLRGQFAVTRTAVRDVAIPVLRHRIIPSFQAEAEGLAADDLVCRLLLETPPFEPKVSRDATARRILRF